MDKNIAKDECNPLNKKFTHKSGSQITKLQSKRQNAKKGNSSNEEYIQKIPKIEDVAVCVHTIVETNLTYAQLNGLEANINPQFDHLSFNDGLESLRSYDAHFTQQNEDNKPRHFSLSTNYSHISR